MDSPETQSAASRAWRSLAVWVVLPAFVGTLLVVVFPQSLGVSTRWAIVALGCGVLALVGLGAGIKSRIGGDGWVGIAAAYACVAILVFLAAGIVRLAAVGGLPG